MCSCFILFRVVSCCFKVQSEVGNWVGLSVVHLGDSRPGAVLRITSKKQHETTILNTVTINIICKYIDRLDKIRQDKIG